MLNVFEIIVPLIVIVLISLPLVKVFQGKVTKRSAKNRLVTHIASFFSLLALSLVFQFSGVHVFAAASAALDGSIAQGLGFLSAALATGMSALGAGIAVAAAAPAAIGAFSENEKNFGKSMIFVVLGEGVAIYGVLISILIIGKL
ncbi:MAG: ATP synthase subunit C [Candidatus Izemoplasmatales bacterium]|jgi:V/A-type H+-transporting ATPase subunit K|nr:ATP synthase subunit C [Candidatus Izemoplasmatales bacterium]